MAIALVVVAHGLIPVMETDVGWAVHEPAGSLVVDGVVWVIRAFVLPLFFVLSGFFAARTVARHGLETLIRRRALRLAVPLVVFIAPVSLAMNALWDLGKSMAAGRQAAAGGLPELRASEQLVTLGHLWFLYYLLIATAAAVAIAAVARWPRWRSPAGAVPLVATPIVAATLWWGGKLQLDTPLGFAIDLPIAAYHGVFFWWGWQLDVAELERYRDRAWLFFALAAALFVALLPALIEGATPVWGFAASAGFTCAMVAGVIGACAKRQPGPRLRLVSRGSYWIYVVHLPLLVAVQVTFFVIDAPVALEVLIAVGVTGALSLSSYRWLVCGTWLERLLG